MTPEMTASTAPALPTAITSACSCGAVVVDVGVEVEVEVSRGGGGGMVGLWVHGAAVVVAEGDGVVSSSLRANPTSKVDGEVACSL